MNGWTRMPPLAEQANLPAPADFTVVRALLRPGRAYEDAVARFQPYNKIGERIRSRAMRCATGSGECARSARTSYIFVNNRLEGNSPETIRAVTEASGQ